MCAPTNHLIEALPSFKEISKRPFFSERTSCPLLVLRVSLHCLIYKVHAVSRRSFIIPLAVAAVKCFFSALFRAVHSHPAAPRSLELLYFTTFRSVCQPLFSRAGTPVPLLPARVPPKGALLIYQIQRPLSTPFFTLLRIFQICFFRLSMISSALLSSCILIKEGGPRHAHPYPRLSPRPGGTGE